MQPTPKHLYILTGASRGLGLAMAKQLVRREHQLLCLSRSINPSLQALADQAGSEMAQRQVDLADGANAARLLLNWLSKKALQHYASATLINNAGVIPPLVPLRDSAREDLGHALRVGLETPMQLCAAFLAGTRGWTSVRKILNVSSGLGRRPMASQACYCAAKAGMDHFTRCLAMEEALTPKGAKVCSLAPGVIDTDMQVQLRSADAAQFPDRGSFEGLKTLGQLTSPDEAARRVLAYLARPDFGEQPVADVRG